ncbi:hypothetical protein GWR56_02715 [Mucilaginibacter sp. 14171R-50]|uniref:OstA-like protein n=1 Tax=Mucilaginibacter sp. 14171R-50 TaxID=2703789 RepID=UPI00138DB928|nr:OstA-like protein [Mucilaginibacter sp. 14171R-50]QHS54508.1 hypothetical protein GWR56_02715 [Mucilaginibacter sp. 14171R-50]
MIKYILSTLLVIITLTVSAQKKSVVHLIQSKSSEVIKLNGRNVIKVYQGVFQQDYSIMRSDSAYFYAEDNAFDAFSNVHITQGDTLNIYADKLNYNGNTKVAVLTDNVRLIDKDAILTTNYLTYNTATRIGTYTGGGKLINKDNTLTSKNGYYFAFSRDSYFRYNVVLITPDALIKTDTLRYNTGSRIAYFYGPTNIYDTKDKKDTLYTENGLYNTIIEQAFFGKKNLYKQGTKTLTGDSLFYDKINGYGRAVKRVTFHDREQNITLKGDLATYYKKGERTVVTKDPYVIIVTEEKDTTKTDTVTLESGTKANPAVKTAPGVKKANAFAIKPPPGTAQVKGLQKPVATDVDTLTVKVQNTLKNNRAGVAALVKKADAMAVKSRPGISKTGMVPLQVIADSAVKVPQTGVKPVKGGTPAKGAGLAAFPITDTAKATPEKKVKRDSIYISADTLETQILTYKDLKIMQEQQRLLNVRDTSVKTKKLTPEQQKKADKFLTLNAPKWKNDTLHLHADFFGKPKPEATAPAKGNAKGQGGAVAAPGQTASKGGDANAVENDPIFFTPPVTLSDTARVRIIKAYHGAKLFKSDLQAKADSMFYSYSDSTLHCFINPLIWTQGSQLSGDTITMQMKNKKLDNLNLFPSSFVVNIEKGDSTNFNQVGGKRMKGFFKSDKLDRMYVAGNAESIYFSRDSLKKVDGMQRSLSSRMRVYFKNGTASQIVFLTKPEHRYGPLAKFSEDDKILKGFIWKPKERPVSKESIIPSYNRKKAREQAAADKKLANKSKDAVQNDKARKDSLQHNLPRTDSTKVGRDSTGTATQGVTGPPVVKARQDSSGIKQPPATTAPVIRTKQDSLKKAKPVPATQSKSDAVKVTTPKVLQQRTY